MANEVFKQFCAENVVVYKYHKCYNALMKILGSFNMNNVKDKVVFITGASSGYGKAMAELFVKEGANVVSAS